MNGYGVSPLEIMASEAMLRGLVFLDQFTYSAVFTGASALGAAATAVVQVNIDADSDFVLQQVNITAQTAGPTIITPNYLILLTRAGSGRQIMNQPQHVQNVCGQLWNNAQPGFAPMPGLMQARNTISVQLQNLTATAATRVDVAMIGFKVFYTKGDRMNVFKL